MFLRRRERQDWQVYVRCLRAEEQDDANFQSALVATQHYCKASF